MKKTIFNASFEESKKLVTKKYVIDCCEARATKRYRKYPFGFFISNLLMSTFLIGIVAVFAWASPENSSYYWRFAKIFFIGSFVIFYIPYIYLLVKGKKKKILAHFLINFSSGIQVVFMSFGILIMACETVTFILGMKNVGVAWFILGMLLMLYFFNKERIDVAETLYNEKTHKNKLYTVLEKLTNLSKKYGWIILILLVLYKRFIHNDTVLVTVSDGTKRDLIQSILGVFSPLLSIISFIFIISILEHHLQGFYLMKYSEEYRQFFGFTKDEWEKGKISKERFEQLKAEENSKIEKTSTDEPKTLRELYNKRMKEKQANETVAKKEKQEQHFKNWVKQQEKSESKNTHSEKTENEKEK